MLELGRNSWGYCVTAYQIHVEEGVNLVDEV